MFSAVLMVSAAFGVTNFAKAAVTEVGPPIYKMFKDTTVGPRSVFPFGQLYDERGQFVHLDQESALISELLPRWII